MINRLTPDSHSFTIELCARLSSFELNRAGLYRALTESSSNCSTQLTHLHLSDLILLLDGIFSSKLSITSILLSSLPLTKHSCYQGILSSCYRYQWIWIDIAAAFSSWWFWVKVAAQLGLGPPTFSLFLLEVPYLFFQLQLSCQLW